MEWTDADVERAAKEGWKRLGGYIARAHDASGLCPFPDTVNVVEFLRAKGKESEWHRQVYLSLPWTYADNLMAARENWRLTFDSILTRSTRFLQTNDTAREYVVTRAQAGDPLHVKALSTLAKRRLIHGDQ